MNIDINLLQFNISELEKFLVNCPIDFQRLGLTKSRLKEATLPLTNHALTGFQDLNMNI